MGEFNCTRLCSSGRDESRVLYILGNGFDLAHGLRTSYRDFRLSCSGAVRSALEDLCPLDANWSNFEEALGRIDPVEVYDAATQETFSWSFEMQGVYEREWAVKTKILEPLREVRGEFLRWLGFVFLSGVEKRYIMSPLSMYLTFNYTNLLQQLYGVSESHVLHIHGALKLGSQIVLGHRTRVDGGGIGLCSHFPDGKGVCKIIADAVNQHYKDVDSIIKANEPFWKSLVEIEEIVVFGHSYNEIDREYFHVVSENAPSAKWIMHTYTSDDRSRAEGLASALGLEESRYEIF